MRSVMLLLAVSTAACSKSTCEKAVNRMIECKMIVGNLLPKASGNQILLDDAHGRLSGACDVAVENNEADRRRMECAARASSCDELMRCDGE